MDLTIEQKLAINMKVARDMWPDCDFDDLSDCDNEDADIIIYGKDTHATVFNIFNSANTTDLNKAVEFYKLDVVNFGQEWHTHNLKRDFPRPINVYKVDVSRDISMQQAVTAASGANQTKEDE